MLRNFGIVVVGCLLSFNVFADVDYYTYGGLQNIVEGFIFVANVFNTGEYLIYAFSFSLLGISAGVAIKSGLAMLGKAKSSDLLSIIFFSLLGTGIFGGLFAAKTTVHIYDPVVNGYESVGDVPLLLATIAHISNSMERTGTDLLADATLFGRDRHANAKSLELIFNLLNSDPIRGDMALSKSVTSYMNTCLTPAVQYPAGYDNFDYNSLLSGTTAFWEELEKTANPSQKLLWMGTSTDCAAAFELLESTLTAPETYTQYIASLCEKTGFDPLVLESIQSCEDLISEIAPMVFSSNVLIEPENLTAMAAVSDSVFSILAESPGTSVRKIGDIRQVSQGFGSLIVTEGWLPSIRVSTLVLILSLTPIIVLFCFTPFLFKSLHMLVSLFFFLFIWGLCDTAMHSIAVASISNMFTDIKSFEGGLWAFMTAPTELQKAIASYGRMQGLGVTIASLFTVVFFKFSPYAFSQVGERIANDVDSIGQRTGSDVLDPVSRTQTMDSAAVSAAKLNQLEVHGSELYGTATGATGTYQLRENAGYLSTMEANGVGNREALAAQGQMNGAGSAGSVLSRLDRAEARDSSVSGLSQDIGYTNQTMNDAQTNYNAEQINKFPNDVQSNADNLTAIKNADLTGKTETTRDPKRWEAVAKTDATRALGESDAIREKFPGAGSQMSFAEQQKTTHIEDSLGEIASRNSLVKSGVVSETQDIPNMRAQVSNESLVGDYSAKQEAIEEGNISSIIDASYRASKVSTRESIAEDNAVDTVSGKLGVSGQDLINRNREIVTENKSVESAQREILSNALGEDTLDVAFRQSPNQSITVGQEDAEKLESLDSGAFPEIVGDGRVTFGLTPNQGVTNANFESGSSAYIRGGAAVFDNPAHMIEEGTDDQVLSMLTVTDTNAETLRLSEDLGNKLPINRTLSESETSGVSTSLDGQVYGVAQVDLGIGKIISKIEGLMSTGKGSAETRDFAGVPVKPSPSAGNRIDGKSVLSKLGPSVSLGGKIVGSVSGNSSDTTSQQASISGNQAVVLGLLAGAKEALLSANNEEEKLAVAQAFRQSYKELLENDLGMSGEAKDDIEQELLEDAYKSDVEQLVEGAEQLLGEMDELDFMGSIHDVFR